MEQLRRELSLRLPPARLLEFTFDDASPGAARHRPGLAPFAADAGLVSERRHWVSPAKNRPS